MKRLEHVRILMYSHDTFGLGHLRRCREIAHALVERFKGLHILIISGSPIAGAFDFRARVDFVKIPSVIKLHNGEYTSIDQHIDIQETLDMRASMIRNTVDSFHPEIFIVDKEPLGLRGELEEILGDLKSRDCTLVLGLRDVMDSPDLLSQEWGKRRMLSKIDELYDDIWVYGPASFWNPLAGLNATPVLMSRLSYTGFLDRSIPQSYSSGETERAPYILVTTGGGGDGANLVRQVLSAYEHDSSIRHDVDVVLGPFMPAEEREEIFKRADVLDRVQVIEFENRIEKRIAAADAIVGMCGYNTFCEILSFDKRALIVPRMRPREEQYVRAVRAVELGLIDMLEPQNAEDPARMAAALRS
ncbi:MAG: glycosyltransferase family protein, partial [Aestuariivirgaceae bacterium]